MIRVLKILHRLKEHWSDCQRAAGFSPEKLSTEHGSSEKLNVSFTNN